MAENVPARESTHLSQMIFEGFNLFDYGPEENMERYGKEDPPRVPVEDITTPVAMFVSQRDSYTPPESTQALAEALGSNLVFYESYDFSLYGYYVAQDVTSALEDMVRVMEAYPAARDQIVS